MPTWLALALQNEANRNIRIPNVRDPYVHVYAKSDDGCKWQIMPREKAMGDVVENVALILEAHAKDDRVGQRFSNWREKLLDEWETNGNMFKQQKQLAFQTIAGVERAGIA